MNKTNLVAVLSERAGISRLTALQVLDVLFGRDDGARPGMGGIIEEALAAGERVSLGLCRMQVHEGHLVTVFDRRVDERLNPKSEGES